MLLSREKNVLEDNTFFILLRKKILIMKKYLRTMGGTSRKVYWDWFYPERRQGTVILSPVISERGGLRRKGGGDPRG